MRRQPYCTRNVHHSPAYWWRGDRMMKPISVWGWLGGHDGQRLMDKFGQDAASNNCLLLTNVTFLIEFGEFEVPKNLDVIVIGSGIGGLTAAAVLGKLGKKVLVLEQDKQAGGLCKTFTEKGFEFDCGKMLSLIHWSALMITTWMSSITYSMDGFHQASTILDNFMRTASWKLRWIWSLMARCVLLSRVPMWTRLLLVQNLCVKSIPYTMVRSRWRLI